MEYADYLRAQAEKFRELAEEVGEPAASEEFSELAAICEHVAAEVEDRLTAG
jgi:hypothetical protein